MVKRITLIGLKIKVERIKRELTQGELSKLCGVSTQTICKIERTNKGNAVVIAKICKALDISVESYI